MKHTVTAYLERLSSRELEGFLWQCCQTRSWGKYIHIIPEIMEILKKRGYPIAKQIQTSWGEYMISLSDHPET